MILIDYSGIAISAIFSQSRPGKITEDFMRHIILNSLRMYNLKYRDKYGRMILACDGGSWRKDYYPQYKAGRKKSRESSDLDWKEIFSIINKIRDEIAEHLPYPVVTVQGAEADDVIGTLVESTQEFGQHEPVMIISADKDFIQLQKYDNVSQYSPMTKKMLSDKNPANYLYEHIFRGDSGDGIPNVLSSDTVFVDGGRQTPLSSTKMATWIAAAHEGKLQSVLPETVYRNYVRNSTVIDLSKTPETVKTAILSAYSECPTVGNSKILNYLISKRCNMLVSCAEEFFTHK
jgi:hypothetical protein